MKMKPRGNPFKKGHKPSEEVRAKISASKKGKTATDATRKKMRDSHLGKRYPKRGPMSEETKIKIGLASKGRKGYWAGKKRPMSLSTKIKIGEAHRGSKSHQWKGGVTSLNKLIRRSAEYKLWRVAVFRRDDFTCVFCRVKGGTLNADHIKPFALFPELRFAIDNGRTLCEACHRTTETYGKRFDLIKK